MENLGIYNLVRSVPQNAQRTIQGGRLNGKTDINPMWRIKTLTEQFGPAGIGWYYQVTKQWTESFGEEIAAFVNIELYICYQGEWSKPIFGTGGSMFVKKERNALYVSDECFKMATTDAISVACKQLGIGADVYWDKDASKYTSPEAATGIGTNRKVEGATETAGAGRAEKEGRVATTSFGNSSLGLELVQKELKRIGYAPVSVCRLYNISDIRNMTEEMIRDFLKKVKEVPDRKVG